MGNPNKAHFMRFLSMLYEAGLDSEHEESAGADVSVSPLQRKHSLVSVTKPRLKGLLNQQV